MEYNERIKTLRIKMGLTQQQLADEIGVSRQTVTRWENGWVVPTLFYAQKLADLFGLTVSVLMTGKDEQPKKEKSSTGSTARFCVLSFLPVAVYCILWFAISAFTRFEYGLSESYDDNLRIRTFTDILYNVSFFLCFTAAVTAIAFWIIGLIEGLRRSTDKYSRYSFYKAWNIGLIFALTNLITLICLNLSFMMTFLPVIYFGTALVAVAVDFVFDFIFKKAFRAKMVTYKNGKLEIINLIYAIIAIIGILGFAAWITYIVVAYYPACGLEIGFTVLYSLIIAFVIDLSYIIVRIAVQKKLRQET